MITKYEIGDKVFIEATVESIEITKYGINYKLSICKPITDSNNIIAWFKEDSIHSRLVIKKEDSSNAKT